MTEATSQSVFAEIDAWYDRAPGTVSNDEVVRWVQHNAEIPCPRCGDDLRRVSYEDYEVTYCPACQTGGKVLADRRLSRLIR